MAVERYNTLHTVTHTLAMKLGLSHGTTVQQAHLCCGVGCIRLIPQILEFQLIIIIYRRPQFLISTPPQEKSYALHVASQLGDHDIVSMLLLVCRGVLLAVV